MKKQILFLAIFSLAIFFAGTNVYGQTVIYSDYVTAAPGCVTAVDLTCNAGATIGHLNPTPGVTYNYSITVNPVNVQSVHWFVTDQASVIDGTGTAPVLQPLRDADGGGGTYILDAEDAPVYNTAANTQLDIDISWKNFNGSTNRVLLVAYVKGAAGCTDNVEVWRIEPVFDFTLDVISMFDDGTLGTSGTPANECVSPVESAIYNGTNLTMNYGENWVFFSVNAANFVHSWLPALSATATTGTVGTIEWATPSEAIENAGGVATGDWHPTTDPVPASAAAVGGIVGATGECIVVRVQIVNGNVEAPEGAAVNVVTLSINGVMYENATTLYTNGALADLDEPATSGDPCRNDYTDQAIFNITARPAITEVTPAPVSFEPKN